MVIFLSGGNTGFFLGPIVAGLLVSGLGLRGMFLLVPTGMVTLALLYRTPLLKGHSMSTTGKESQHVKKRLLLLLATL